MSKRNYELYELKSMLDIIVGDASKEEKKRQLRNVKQTLNINGVLLPSRQKRMRFWEDVAEEFL